MSDLLHADAGEAKKMRRTNEKLKRAVRQHAYEMKNAAFRMWKSRAIKAGVYVNDEQYVVEGYAALENKGKKNG